MTRRYISKKTKERFRRLAKNADNPKYITEKGPNIPELDDTKSNRMIFFKDIESLGVTFEDIVNEKIDDLCNTAEETSQFIKKVNMHLKKQNAKINELKKIQKEYEIQMRNFYTRKET